ncbi:MAG: glutathione peroxidase [Phenylobacterium sp.]|uniref:glutathione peroxidase n=1 Tax=Phenylobacterium sp. TaxID=1871053 RepID=UPI0027374967|nr:glutathione peroxidase [Phenylobacterium sp.]MDP3174264.1 glutathione peroxidase [Phenylobacterium sp.]
MAESLYDIPLTSIDGAPTKLGDHAGKVLLVVNVASKCGLSPQYGALQALYAAKRDEGLVVLGFPANNFRDQEPGTENEIAEFCSTTYGVDFPMFEKISVAGSDKHPLYKALTVAAPVTQRDAGMRKRLEGFGIETGPPGEVLWNFEKFVVGRDGAVVARFSPDVTPDDAELAATLDKALAAPA